MRTLDLKRTLSADEQFASDPTMTLGELQKAINWQIEKHGRDYQVRVDTSYDQGQRYIAITGVEDRDGYVGIQD